MGSQVISPGGTRVPDVSEPLSRNPNNIARILQWKQRAAEKTTRAFWRTQMMPLARLSSAIILVIGLIGAGCPDQSYGQTPGYGQRPDNWAPYKGGPYLEQLQEILKKYHVSGGTIAYLHYEGMPESINSVDLFRISTAEECSERTCYFVIFAADFPKIPLMTECQFLQAGLAHLFNPDGSKFFGFEFSCKESLLHVQVSKTQFWVSSQKKNQ